MAEVEEGPKEVKQITAKEAKKLARPEFESNPDKFYPTEVCKRFGFSRARCDCGHFYWRHSEKQTTCGDSSCVGSYTFIGRKTGLGKDHKVGYAEAWETLKTSLENARVPHTAIKRYPVVARWRQDVDYVAAGIFCFQPFCVTGELEPPANPLCCPQFCLRFNDLDSIGITGRHYSGFIMLGIQVFNKPEKFVYFKDECVEFNLNWLIHGLKIDPDEITLIEDVWAGGGNLGPSMEYFVGGLELGNMVFMQYKVFPDGSRQELPVKVIDVGIGLERVPWLLNGTPTSYVDVFPQALEILTQATGVNPMNETWEKFGPLSCILNADECENMDKAWQNIAERLGMDVQKLKHDIETVRDLYIVADHTRTVMLAIEDGSLPSNVGGAGNLRNVLRRVFHVLEQNKWWDKLGMDGLMALFDAHRRELSAIYGPFAPYPSFRAIIEIEFQRWKTTDSQASNAVKKLQDKRKAEGKSLEVPDWILCMTTYGLDADKIAQITKLEVPPTLYADLAQYQEGRGKEPVRQLYDTVHLPPTEELFYHTPAYFEFTARVVSVFRNVQKDGVPNLLILDRTCFYPLGGGQENDKGRVQLQGEEYQVVAVTKVGKCVLHELDRPLADAEAAVGITVHGFVDVERRVALRNHHTATHVLSAACRKVLGPHVWQNGAKKTEHSAHLDITHFRSLTRAEVVAIENECNRFARQGATIRKYEMPKEEAEKEFGFSLYQGGVVPGSTLRIVNIEGIDQEACCGTHADNTSEIGFVRVLTTKRISDGIVRLYFVAGDRAIDETNRQAQVLQDLEDQFGIPSEQVVQTVGRFFQGYKDHMKVASELVELQVKSVVFQLRSNPVFAFLRSGEDSATSYIGLLPQYAAELRDRGCGLVVVGKSFLYGIVAPAVLSQDALREALTTAGADVRKLVVKTSVAPPKPSAAAAKAGAAKKPAPVDNLLQFQLFGQLPADAVMRELVRLKAVEMQP